MALGVKSQCIGHCSYHMQTHTPPNLCNLFPLHGGFGKELRVCEPWYLNHNQSASEVFLAVSTPAVNEYFVVDKHLAALFNSISHGHCVEVSIHKKPQTKQTNKEPLQKPKSSIDFAPGFGCVVTAESNNVIILSQVTQWTEYILFLIVVKN